MHINERKGRLEKNETLMRFILINDMGENRRDFFILYTKNRRAHIKFGPIFKILKICTKNSRSTIVCTNSSIFPKLISCFISN